MTSQQLADELLAEYQKGKTMSENGEPHTPPEKAHARVGYLVSDLDSVIADLAELRLDPIAAPFVAMEFANLMRCKTALDVLASNILETADRKLRIVQNG